MTRKLALPLLAVILFAAPARATDGVQEQKAAILRQIAVLRAQYDALCAMEAAAPVSVVRYTDGTATIDGVLFVPASSACATSQAGACSQAASVGACGSSPGTGGLFSRLRARRAGTASACGN
jgi:hypothetical protein